MTKQKLLYDYPKEINTLAKKYARAIIRQQAAAIDEGNDVLSDYQAIDINSIDNEDARTVGAEHVVLETIKELAIDRKLKSFGLNRFQICVALGVIAGRMMVPGSERATHQWMQNVTALDELLGAVLVKAGLSENHETDELELYCHSLDKEKKEEGPYTIRKKRDVTAILKARNALDLKYGTKQYVKVIERIGRLKEKFKLVSHQYKVTVEKDDKTDKAINITWSRKKVENTSGVYCLRTNRKDLDEKQIWDIYTMLTDVEDAFRCMKSELGLRPIYHQKETRCDGHLFITAMAYHLLHTIRYKLRQKGVR
jgi:hypothetical protein